MIVRKLAETRHDPGGVTRVENEKKRVEKTHLPWRSLGQSFEPDRVSLQGRTHRV